MSDSEEPTYAIRLHHRARLDIEEIRLRLAELSDAESAAQWTEGLLDAAATLAHSPRRCSLAREDALFHYEVRQLLFRRRPGNAIYRILFTVYEVAEEAPFVFILHVRHGAQSAITADEANALEEHE